MRYNQIKPILDETILDEVKMSPSALKNFANSPEAEGMLVGIEFEMGVPGVEDVDMEPEWEYDYDQNQSAGSVDEIINFFRDGEFSNLGPSSANRLRDEMYQQYQEWLDEKISDNLDEDELTDRIRDRLMEELDWEDYVDQAEEELEAAGEMPDDSEDPDARSQAINLKAKELLENYVDEELMGNSRDYERAYDDIRDEMYDEMRNDGDYDEEAWLSDIGVDDMQDAEREWSLDWPHMYDTNYGDGGGADLDTVADEFSQAMGGVKVNTSGSYHGAHRDGTSWIIEPDGSIDAERGDAGLEFVSPPMPLKQGLEAMQQFYACAKERGCYTNKSTGLHMNISVPDLTVENLDYVKLALFLGDEYVLKQFGREYNNYAKSAMSKIKDRIRPEDVPAVLNQMKQHLNSLASKTIHSGITDKFTSINTKTNYVEFRGPGGDYLDMNPLELVNTALRAALALRIASNPEAYKQEYAKKLFKLVERSEGEDDAVKLFSQYAVGDLPKDELIARVKFAQRGRQLAKGKKDSVTRMMDDPQVKEKVNELPLKWRQHLRDNLSEASDQQLQSLVNNIVSGEYNEELTPDQRSLVTAIVTNELAVRQAEGEKKQYWVTNRNGEGGKQMVYARNENEAILMGGKQIGLTREQSISRLKAVERVDRSDEELLNSLPEDWREYYDKISDASLGVLRGGLDSMTTGRYQYRNLDDDQVGFIKQAIENEMRSRQDGGEDTVDNNETRWQVRITRGEYENNTVYVDADTPRQAKLKAVNIFQRSDGINVDIGNLEAIATTQDAQGTNNGTDAAVLSTLPEMFQHWLSNIGDHSDMGIINTLNNTRTYTDLTDQQAAYFRIRIKRELRSRGINPDTAAPSPTNPYADDAAERERMAREREQISVDMSSPDDESITDIMGNGEEEQDAAVAQQSQLINRDDPVSSNDPEARSPIAQEGPGMWMVGNHTYGRETFRANSRNEAIQAYAERNDITVDDLTSDRSFVAQLTQPDQGELDLREMRRLAGLI